MGRAAGWAADRAHAGKGNAACGLLIKCAKTGFLDYKWSNPNAPGSYTPLCHSLLVSIVVCPGRAGIVVQVKNNVAAQRKKCPQKYHNVVYIEQEFRECGWVKRQNSKNIARTLKE